MSDILKEINNLKNLIDAGKNSIFHLVLDSDFAKAKRVAEEVTELKLRLKSLQDSNFKFI